MKIIENVLNDQTHILAEHETEHCASLMIFITATNHFLVTSLRLQTRQNSGPNVIEHLGATVG
jgi:hypothetical protein